MMGEATPEPMLSKVRKLLAKAEATDNVNEAEAFSAKAAALIAAHRIDPTHLATGSDGDDRLIVLDLPIGRGAYVRARLALLAAVAAAHDCELVWRSSPTGAVAVLAGFSGDIDTTVLLYESLHLQAAGQMAGVRRSTPAATQRWRRAFLFGFASRVDELLTATRQEAERTVQARGSRLPELVARRARVSAHAAESFGRVVGARAPSAAVAGGWDQGHRAAGRADLGRRRVAGRPAIGPGVR
ncbi:MAG: DUF2786 domain-containing protein [Ilumatobacteraceae bacterium]